MAEDTHQHQYGVRVLLSLVEGTRVVSGCVVTLFNTDFHEDKNYFSNIALLVRKIEAQLDPIFCAQFYAYARSSAVVEAQVMLCCVEGACYRDMTNTKNYPPMFFDMPWLAEYETHIIKMIAIARSDQNATLLENLDSYLEMLMSIKSSIDFCLFFLSRGLTTYILHALEMKKAYDDLISVVHASSNDVLDELLLRSDPGTLL